MERRGCVLFKILRRYSTDWLNLTVEVRLLGRSSSY